jgi:hypothetical protein
MGTWRGGPSNCEVLVKWTKRIAPHSTKSTSPHVRWVLGFHSPESLGTKFPDRRKEKKPIQRAAHGQVTRGIEVDEGLEGYQVCDGEVSFWLRCLQVTANSFEATCQGREICCCYRGLDSNPNL